MSELGVGGNLGGYDPRNAGALAEAKAVEAGLPGRRPVDAPRWPSALGRWLVLGLAAVVVAGWALTILNAR